MKNLFPLYAVKIQRQYENVFVKTFCLSFGLNQMETYQLGIHWFYIGIFRNVDKNASTKYIYQRLYFKPFQPF